MREHDADRRRPDFRTVDRWAIELLLEAGAIHKCGHRGWAKDRADPHAREEALRTAREEPLAGLSADEAVAAVREMFVGDVSAMLVHLADVREPKAG
jgi:hypothetical protein